MDKRQFIKTSLIGVIGMVAMPSFSRNAFRTGSSVVNIPSLSFKFDSFGDFLSEKNLQEHYNIFLNASESLKNYLSHNNTKIQKISDILLNPEDYDSATIKSTGTYLNHRIFFKTLSLKGNNKPKNALSNAIVENFGNFESFKAQFEKIALSQSNSGWVWLTYRNNKLFITTTNNDLNPFMRSLPDDKRGYPVLGLDVWEHAYYTDYENDSKKYVENFWNYIDWDFIGKRFERAIKSKI
jgi:Fe-Mn family superoxide dismutase